MYYNDFYIFTQILKSIQIVIIISKSFYNLIIKI